MTVALISLLALAIFGGGFLMDEHIASRRFAAILWEHQKEMGKGMLVDMTDAREALRDVAAAVGETHLEEVSRTVH